VVEMFDSENLLFLRLFILFWLMKVRWGIWLGVSNHQLLKLFNLNCLIEFLFVDEFSPHIVATSLIHFVFILNLLNFFSIVFH
jgi:hypothetical protein